jgi:integrase
LEALDRIVQSPFDRPRVGADFRPLAVNEIRPADVLRWRDGLQLRPGIFNRTIPVFASVMKYAEQLGHRAKGSNPCKGTPRFRREPMQRFLSPKEYGRIGAILREHEKQSPMEVAVLRVLLYTGARRSEIEKLRWSEVEPGRLRLADSKTGPKTIYLNMQAEAVFNAVSRRDGCDYVFPNAWGKRPLNIEPTWRLLRREAALPDVRLHDLRHSFASVGVASGFGLPMIARLLGHAELDTTARYAHLADQSVSEAAERVSSGLARCLGMQA